MTATMDADYSEIIMAASGISKMVNIVASSPERKNIRLVVKKIRKDDLDCLWWIIEGLKSYGIDSPKVMIYCKTFKMVGWLLEKVLMKLGDSAYVSNDRSKGLIIGVYHAKTSDRKKKQVLTSLKNDTNIRLVIATSCLGCGVDVKNVQYVVHYGPCFDLADYVQQMGRAGRNTQNLSHAILYWYPSSIRHVSKKLATFLNNSESNCLRVSLYSHFNDSKDEITPTKPGHMCCSFCNTNCSCSGGKCLVKFPFEQYDCDDDICADEDDKNDLFRNVTADDIDLVKLKLSEYQDVATSMTHPKCNRQWDN